mgnify:CR=1 FL=1
MARRKKHNRSKRKATRQQPGWVLLLGVVVVLVALVAAFGGRERTGDVELPEQQADRATLSERLVGEIRLDSLIRLYRTVDPDRSRASLRRAEDSLFVERVSSFSEARFRLIYLNQRSSEDLRTQEELGIRVLPGKEKGYVLALSEQDDVLYAKVPFELLGGLMNAVGDQPLTDSLRSLPLNLK